MLGVRIGADCGARRAREQYGRFRPSVVLIEDEASGTQLIQQLIRDGMYACRSEIGVTACEVSDRHNGWADGASILHAVAVPGGCDCVASRKTPGTR